ncbi:aminoglycoside phosphotransferase family protein [Deinococcus aerophilus]|uniref:Aminoglycoside phosphotransferase n=1 Tax=Deinococcus aerophilus TaxID=522488 RepID=A0ABQ2GQH2_9DEIO|nr:aminoglycoside phosphotransferase family protein [Deinococcus aerophilus]GGM06012.1 aminoglycoside phosphotransferase [Deinococcus aerophilus]
MTDPSGHPPEITSALVRRLIAAQFPQWADLPVTPVASGGWDNRTFHLGSTMTVRLPSAGAYAPQVDKEQRWLPVLAGHLPLPIPVPLGLGRPGEGYPWPWSVYRWLEGETMIPSCTADLPRLAADLGRFLGALQAVDATDGPPAGAHSFFRGASLQVYDAQTRQVLTALADEVGVRAATAVWEAALHTPWPRPPVWFHGDVAAGNLLIREDRLAAVIDFGCAGVGDPACDLVAAWTLFWGESREVFRAALPLDAATWARGRGWALWKALITLEEHREPEAGADPLRAAEARRVLGEVLADSVRGS